MGYFSSEELFQVKYRLSIYFVHVLSCIDLSRHYSYILVCICLHRSGIDTETLAWVLFLFGSSTGRQMLGNVDQNFIQIMFVYSSGPKNN